MNKEEISYSEAQKELEIILNEIETGEVDVDVLSEKVKRACFLIKLCNAKLKSTDEEIKKILDEFEKESNG
ncbi:MAG: exodeoxyribonuclease VII small subunit [Bacteroidota bacterium]|nr:exodeoxyribonuclease VII small subunit [Bacteroidota bacterium]